MDFHAGDKVVYGSMGVCTFKGTEKRTIDGIGEKEYCKLVPADGSSAAYYVPAGSADEKIRPLLTKDQVYALIDEMPDIEPLTCENSHEWKTKVSAVMQSGNYENIISVIKAIHSRRRSKRKLNFADERTMKTAKSAILGEFSVILGMTESQTDRLICERLGVKCETV